MSTSLRFLCCTLLATFACSREQQATAPVALELVADGFVHPVLVTEPPDGSGRLFVVDQVGKIWIIAPDGGKMPEPFLDVSEQLVDLDESYDERGLLGLAFHPTYASNGRFYVFYTVPLREQAPDDFDHTNILAEFQVMEDDPNRADASSERRLMEIDHPSMNHDGGTVAFGPDNMLYISLGDGGGRDDRGIGHVEDWYDVNVGGNGQDIEENLFGSILRIDVDGELPYSVPADNPFTSTPGVKPEIWAYGLRNPYRFTFAPGGSGELIVGDVGQEMYEEITVVTRGSNHGWNVYEGSHCFNTKVPTEPLDSCPTTVGAGHPAAGDPLVPPVIELKNNAAFGGEGLGLAVVGGSVVRGESLPSEYRGRYVFGMWSSSWDQPSGRLFVATMAAEGTWPWEPLRLPGAPNGNLDGYLLGFGENDAGEIFVLTSQDAGPSGDTGKVYRLVATDRAR